MEDIGATRHRQSGVLSRHQLLAAGLGAADVRRLLRRRELTRVHAGVYVDHTGPLTSVQQAWSAVLALWPAALCHGSAVRLGAGPLHVAIDRDRSPAAPSGVRLHRLVDLDRKVLWSASPPRVRLEEAVLDVAALARSEMDAIAALADAVQSRRATADRLARALEGRERIPRRPLLAGVLGDVADGACSVLEQGYLHRVERAHGLPRPVRQARAGAGRTSYRDVDHAAYGLVVELDGRLFHDTATARDRDLDRDLDAAVAGRRTVRLGWGQVFDRPCATAARLAHLLQQGGWTGGLRPCPDCPS